MPLTAAIHLVFGSRDQDNARPLGAFYPQNVSSEAWEHLGGIWYRARDEQKVLARRVNPEVVCAFARSIRTGQDVLLPSGNVIDWERIPAAEASSLPPPLREPEPAGLQAVVADRREYSTGAPDETVRLSSDQQRRILSHSDLPLSARTGPSDPRV